MEVTQPFSAIESDAKVKIDFFYQLGEKISAEPDLSYLLEQIIEMTQKSLRAAAASILLFKEDEQELYFEAASGPVGKIIKSVKVDIRNSIAGQVMRSGKPLIINDVKKDSNFRGQTDETTGFTTNSLIAVPLMIQQKTLGVLEVLNKLDGSNFNESDLQVMVPVGVTAAMAIENARLHNKLLDAYKNTLITLTGIIDAKDPYTCGHSQRVMEYAMMAGAALSFSPDRMETLEYAGLLHDIGKIAFDEVILNKPGRLTLEEWDKIREHPRIGGELLKKIPFLEKTAPGAIYHHEHYDGTGYPAGIKGGEIPL
jgi:HD-GYP domain-containing protein (c-di-GMP phosphodiesterase class II)